MTTDICQHLNWTILEEESKIRRRFKEPEVKSLFAHVSTAMDGFGESVRKDEMRGLLTRFQRHIEKGLQKFIEEYLGKALDEAVEVMAQVPIAKKMLDEKEHLDKMICERSGILAKLNDEVEQRLLELEMPQADKRETLRLYRELTAGAVKEKDPGVRSQIYRTAGVVIASLGVDKLSMADTGENVKEIV